MPLMTNLLKHPKTGVYYFRKTVPAELRDVFGKREFKESLGTKEPREARVRAHEVGLKYESALEQARSGSELSLDDAESLAREWLRAVLEEDMDDRALGRVDSAAGEILSDYGRLLAEGKPDEQVRQMADEVASERGMVIARSTLGHSRLSHAMLRAYYEYLKVLDERDSGKWPSLASKTRRASTPAAPTNESTGGPSLRECLERFKVDPNRQPKRRTVAKYETGVQKFIATNGDLPITVIQREHVKRMRDAALKKPDGPPAPSTVNGYIGAISALVGWAVDNDYRTDGLTLRGLEVKDNVPDQDKRHPFTLEDLRTIFTSGVYSRPSQEGMYWIPLVAIFTGARVEEIGRLKVCDVCEEDGVRFFDFSGDHIKGKGSWRRTPLHPELLRCGLLKLVSERGRKGDGERLWPDVKSNIQGNVTAAFSKSFGRHLRSIGITDTKKTFHSTRHSFKHAAREANIDEEVHDALTGHTNASVGRKYGSARGYPLRPLERAIEKIRYEGLDLSRLYVEN